MCFVLTETTTMSLEPIHPERALELYLDHRRNEVAAATLTSHRSRLQYLIRWCLDEGIDNLNHLTGRKLYEYRIWRRDDGDLSKVSEKTQMATVRVFVKWLESIEAVEPDLHTKVQLPSLATNEDVRDAMIGAEQMEEILGYLHKYQYASLRHVVLLLSWRTAMRRGAIHGLDVEDYSPGKQCIEVIHRPDTGTPIKNKESGERYVALSTGVCDILDDWLEEQRPDVSDDYDRSPLIASTQGRLAKTSIGKILYELTRPCVYTGECPHGRDLNDCPATRRESASRCPSSRSPHAARRGAITHWLSSDVPTEVISGRANVGPAVLERHYDARDEESKMEQRRGFIEDI